MAHHYHAGETVDIGLKEALSITLGTVKQVPPVTLPVEEVCGRVAAEDLFAVVDSPSATASLRDGYAVISKDIEGATKSHPVRLEMAGTSTAGDVTDRVIQPGAALKVLTGARLPGGADAVIAVEYAREEGDHVVCFRDAPAGRNVLFQGADVAIGKRLAGKGEVLTPGLTGLLAAGGISHARVIQMPRVGLVATGDEVVAPGRVLEPGQLYASNLVTLHSWLRQFRAEAKTDVARDDPDMIREAFSAMLQWADVLLTSGGAWKSERDLTVRVLEEMGCRVMFHRIRMGPGKAVAFGMIREKAVFCLPGGPPSNEMAFLQIALPGILQMGGRPPSPFQIKQMRIAETVGGTVDWTQFLHAVLERRGNEWWAVPQRLRSRLQSQARAEALIRVPEGVGELKAGEMAEVQMLTFP
ncbi:MAG: molybdopterin molybdotransferase MoeA [Deltaproteobacteria bacterium]|nr:molybdopterin molybdotransferase MoeA [Deltaproteobacteria bacterium]